MKIAVYTAIFDDKDEIHDPLNYDKSNNIDYFLITDNSDIKSNNYKTIFKNSIYNDITKNARNYKVNGLDLFRQYDFIIWHDANIQIVDPEVNSLVSLIDNKEIAFFRHPERNCVYDEAIKCIELEKDFPFRVFKQMYSYFIRGLENNSGLYATGIFVINIKLISKDFLNLWWKEIENKSRRDQLSLPYVLKECHVKPKIIMEDIRNNEYSVFQPHKHKKYNFIATNYSKPISMFSKRLSIKSIRLLKKINSY